MEIKKRYQVFISSTYSDLKDERDSVTRALMEMDCIPAGMEAFPAADEAQLEFIKRVIDDSDYYVLLVAGRYGSMDQDGISFTEREYHYAVGQGIPVLAFVHSDVDSLPPEKSDKGDHERAYKLQRFRKEVIDSRLAKMWDDPKTLAGSVILALNRAIATQPRTGWIRGDTATSAVEIKELLEARKEIDRLTEKLSKLKPDSRFGFEIAGFDAILKLCGSAKIKGGSGRTWTNDWDNKASLKEIFFSLSPHLNMALHEDSVARKIGNSFENCEIDYGQVVAGSSKIDDNSLALVRIQLEAMGLIDVKQSKTVSGGVGTFWQLTDLGLEEMYRMRVVPKQD